MITKNKILIWIDDSEKNMEQIAEEAFAKLWKKGIFNRTIFLGDYEKKVTTEDCATFCETVNDLFYELCDWEGIDENSSKTALKDLYDEYEDTGVVEDIADCITTKANDNVLSIIEFWKNLSNKEQLFSENNGNLNKVSNFSCFFSEKDKSKNYVYALDLVLLKIDEKNLNCDPSLSVPILSMGLYHYITKELGAKCILYTKYSYLNRLQQNWKSLYTEIYGEIDMEDIDIISREDFYKGSFNEKSLEKILNLFKEDVQ